MDGRETYMNVKFTKTDSRFPSPAEPDVTYAELNVKTLSAAPDRTDGDGLNSTYSELNFLKEEPRIDVNQDPPIASGAGGLTTTAHTDGLNSTYSVLTIRKKKPRIDEGEDPPISSGPGGLSTTAQTAAQERESKVKIGNRPYRLICLLCLVTFALIVTVVGLSIHVSQIPQSLKRMNSDLRHQFTEMEMKYRSFNETKAQICELLTSRREQNCSQYWIGNEGGCYFISTFKFSYDKARLYCSDSHSKLLEINSAEEENFVVKADRDKGISYWIGKCKDGKVASNVLFRMNGGDFQCGKCTNDTEVKDCSQVRARFICEKSEFLYPDIYEMIKDLCQQPVGPTGI
ncbi:C-type lectin domain family 9 member A-like [Hemitrygon akajei]|uniref:C-type lectin domain family 9 member A-like n=1 Tax=Hemitrygon akajei TaxID=2704970 RepID=UPI003BF94FDF